MRILAVIGANEKKLGSAFARQLANHADEIKEMFPVAYAGAWGLYLASLKKGLP